MRRVILISSIAAALSSAAASTPVDPAAAERAAKEAAAGRRAYDAMPDTPGTGSYPAIKEVDPTLPDHVVYRPANLSALGSRKLGILVWGNGGCSDDGASARLHLEEIASHGYLVIAPGTVRTGPGAPASPAPAPTPVGIAPVKTSAADVLKGLDWALAENLRRGSRYHGRIDARAVAVSGHSCGGLQALRLAGDRRIRAVIIHNSGIFADGSNPIRGITVDKSLLKRLHTPILYVLGGKTDIAYPNGTDDFAKIDHVPAMLLNLDVGHGGTFRQPNGGPIAQVDVQWLDWQLRGDRRAAAAFTGNDCGLCRDPKWTVERKRIG